LWLQGVREPGVCDWKSAELFGALGGPSGQTNALFNLTVRSGIYEQSLVAVLLRRILSRTNHDRPWARLWKWTTGGDCRPEGGLRSGEVTTKLVVYGFLYVEEIVCGYMALVERGFKPLGTDHRGSHGQQNLISATQNQMESGSAQQVFKA
jgi:hypothetical protein